MKCMQYFTPYPRELRNRWYLLVERDKRSVEDVCRTFGIPRKTYYKWYRRDHGLETAVYRSRLPDRKTKLTPELKLFIEQTKRKTNYGPLKMKLAIKRHCAIDVSTTIVYRYYRRKFLIRRPQKKLAWYQPMKEKLVIHRAGEGVQMDVKYVYGAGKRQYQFSALDPYTELHFFIIDDTRESKNAIALFQKAEQYFGFPILSVQTDNGSEFRGEFHTWLTANNISHYFIPKKSPQWNGKVERVHKTIDDEYYHNPLRVWRTPAEWLEYYNGERIHLSLGGLTPRQKVELYLLTVTPCC